MSDFTVAKNANLKLPGYLTTALVEKSEPGLLVLKYRDPSGAWQQITVRQSTQQEHSKSSHSRAADG